MTKNSWLFNSNICDLNLSSHIKIDADFFNYSRGPIFKIHLFIPYRPTREHHYFDFFFQKTGEILELFLFH